MGLGGVTAPENREPACDKSFLGGRLPCKCIHLHNFLALRDGEVSYPIQHPCQDLQVKYWDWLSPFLRESSPPTPPQFSFCPPGPVCLDLSDPRGGVFPGPEMQSTAKAMQMSHQTGWLWPKLRPSCWLRPLVSGTL